MNDRLRYHGQRLELLGDRARRSHACQCFLRLNQLAHHDVVGTSQGTSLVQSTLSVLFRNAVSRQAAGIVEPRMLLIEFSNIKPYGAIAQVKLEATKAREQSRPKRGRRVPATASPKPINACRPSPTPASTISTMATTTAYRTHCGG